MRTRIFRIEFSKKDNCTKRPLFAENSNAVGVSPQFGEGGTGNGEGGMGIRLRQGYGGQVGEWGSPQNFQTFQTSQTS